MVSNNKAIQAFLDSISDEKLQNFASSENTLVRDYKNEFRMDHQGVNQDGSNKHRLYIQPLGGKSNASRGKKSNVLAHIHVTDPGDFKAIRDGLLVSFNEKAKLQVLD